MSTNMRVEIRPHFAVHLHHLAAGDTQAGLRVIRAVGDDQPGFGPGLNKGLLVDLAFGEDLKAF
jgi:hypothetical protein